jgi:hypothetical protein
MDTKTKKVVTYGHQKREGFSGRIGEIYEALD